MESKIILQTERLLLREFIPSDAAALFLLNNDPQVLQFTGDRPFASESEAAEFIENYDHYRLHGYGRWAVLLRSNKEFIGWCGLKSHEDVPVDVGFRFFQQHWNKGYATEAAKACLDYGFHSLGIPEIMGRCSRQHDTSARVLKKLGFVFWKNDHDEDIGAINCFRIYPTS